MKATCAARAGRRPVVLAAIAALHIGALELIAGGLVPRLVTRDPFPPPIRLILLPRPPTPVAKPVVTGPLGIVPPRVDLPQLLIPRFDEEPPSPDAIRDPAAPTAGSGPVTPEVDEHAPALRTRDGRLAALIDACYPAASRRLAEEGRAVVRIVVGADGHVAAWSVEKGSGIPRLDAALGCVVRRLEFVVGRRLVC